MVPFWMVKRSEKGYILAKKGFKRATKMGSQWVPFWKNPHYQHCDYGNCPKN